MLELQQDRPESLESNLLKGYILTINPEAGILPKSLQLIGD